MQSPPLTHSDGRDSASVPDIVQIIEPQKPGSASARPNAQQACAAWNIFKEKLIECQQQPDIQRSLVFLSITAPAKTHRYSNHRQFGQRSLRDSVYLGLPPVGCQC